MQRAATGLATVCAAAARPALRAPGRRCSSAPATTAATRCSPARSCARRGARVTAVLLDPDRAHAAGLAALRAGRRPGRCRRTRRRRCIGRADLVLDGMLGIGGRGGLRPDAAALARAAAGGRRRSRSPSTSPAASTPTPARSTGAAFPAMHTVTFGAVKPGLVVGEGRGYAGEVHLVDIGLGPHLPPADRRSGSPTPTSRPGSPRRRPGDDKYSQGVVGVVAGSATYPGAGVLCTGAALRTRPGLVRYAGTAADGVRAAWPEAIVTAGRPGDAGRVQAWVVGPGMGTDDDARSVLAEVLGTDLPGGRRRRRADAARRRPGPGPRPRRRRRVLTPHDREFARLRAPSVGRRPDRRRPPAGRRPRLRRPAQGRRHRRRRRRRHRVRQRAPARPGWPPPAPATCSPGSPARCCADRAWPRRGRRRSPPTCTAGPGSWRPSAGR